MNKFIILFISITAFCFKMQGQEIIELKSKNGVYYIPCIVNNIETEFIFDTGASSISISKDLALKFVANGMLASDDIISKTRFSIADGSVHEGLVINIKFIRIGSKTIRNVRATVVNNHNAPLLLGQSVLKQFGQFYFNYESNLLMIGKKNSDNRINTTKYQDVKFQSRRLFKVFNANTVIRKSPYDNSAIIAYMEKNKIITGKGIKNGFLFFESLKSDGTSIVGWISMKNLSPLK